MENKNESDLLDLLLYDQLSSKMIVSPPVNPILKICYYPENHIMYETKRFGSGNYEFISHWIDYDTDEFKLACKEVLKYIYDFLKCDNREIEKIIVCRQYELMRDHYHFDSDYDTIYEYVTKESEKYLFSSFVNLFNGLEDESEFNTKLQDYFEKSQSDFESACASFEKSQSDFESFQHETSSLSNKEEAFLSYLFHVIISQRIERNGFHKTSEETKEKLISYLIRTVELNPNSNQYGKLSRILYKLKRIPESYKYHKLDMKKRDCYFFNEDYPSLIPIEDEFIITMREYEIELLEQEIQDLKTQILYAPGGVGAEDAKKSFERSSEISKPF